MDDRLSRVSAIKDGATSLAAYTYLGSGTVTRQPHCPDRKHGHRAIRLVGGIFDAA